MLTKTKIQRLKTPTKLERHLDSDSLYLEVTKTGSKIWRYRHKNYAGSWTMKALGTYPNTTLDQARTLRDELSSVVQYKSVTFELAASQWLDYKGYTSSKNKQLIERRIERYLLPTLGHITVSHFKPRDTLPILKQLESDGYLELAKRVQNITSQIFKYSVQNLYCEANPAQPLQGCTKQPRVRHMPGIIEQGAFARMLSTIDQASNLMPSVKLCLQIAPHVFLRSESIRLAHCDDVDLDRKLWTIPKDKMGREHVIPLTEPVIALLKLALKLSDGVRYCLMVSGRVSH